MDIRDHVNSDRTLLYCSQLWIKGAIFQGKRLLELHRIRLYEFREMVSNPEFIHRIVVDQSHPNDMDLIEADFFVNALYKAYKFTNMLSQKFDVINNVITILGRSVSLTDLKDVRDMMNHQDEYVMPGGGKFSNRYFKKSDDGISSASADSIGFTDDELWIGNRIEVYRVYKALCDILLILEKFEEENRETRIFEGIPKGCIP